MIQSFCSIDHKPLVANYELDQGNPNSNGRSSNIWRFHDSLPIIKKENRVSLGEGFTPLLSLCDLQKKYDQSGLLLKDESGIPTGSFKARGLCIAVSKAKELGIEEMCIPTAGNAGSALSAYCAKANIAAHVFMPKQTPKTFTMDYEIMGANVTVVHGSIADAAKVMKSKNPGTWFDVSTLKEPFRLEGKKSMGYEIAEQLDWQLPDVIIYPTGGGTGLIGIWKAFLEMKAMRWINKIPTRMVVVQGNGCNPVVTSFNSGLDEVMEYHNPLPTIANGLRVPKPFGESLIMNTIYKSSGSALSVSDKEIIEGMKEFAKIEGIFLSPEGAATLVAYKKLAQDNWIKKNEIVVLLNTSSVYKSIENL